MLIRRLIAAFLVLASLSAQAYAGCICPMASGSAPPSCCEPGADNRDCVESGNLSGCGQHTAADSALLIGGSKSDHHKSFPHQPFDPPIIAASHLHWAPAVAVAAAPLGLVLAPQHHSVPLYLETARLRL